MCLSRNLVGAALPKCGRMVDAWRTQAVIRAYPDREIEATRQDWRPGPRIEFEQVTCPSCTCSSPLL